MIWFQNIPTTKTNSYNTVTPLDDHDLTHTILLNYLQLQFELHLGQQHGLTFLTHKMLHTC